MTKSRIALIALLALAAPAIAYHRQTPPIVPLTSSGENALPRVPAGGRRLALALGSGSHQIFRQDRVHNLWEQITRVGDNVDPTISASGSVIAWDGDCSVIGCTDPGRQIFRWVNGHIDQITHDLTGTSVEPALSGKGSQIAFESLGDLADTGNAGVRQIFLRNSDGSISQVTHGVAGSRNAALDRSGVTMVFESSNDLAGNDTGVVQVWLISRRGGGPLTSGAGASRNPAISSDGRVLAFESRAALLGDGHDTETPQIFAYNLVKGTLVQITNDSSGCTGASAQKIPRDWSVGFVCHGEGFFHHLIEGVTYRLPIDAGDTSEAVTELGAHFMLVSTTADMMAPPGTTPNHQLYMLNLFKLAASPAS